MPIINALINGGFEPILASDGNALLLLQEEFPFLKSYTLPSYKIKYTKSGENLKYKLLLSVPSIISAVINERKIVSNLVEKEGLDGIISDNRFGVFSTKVPSIYITHQLNVLSGNSTYFTSKIHQKIIQNFNEVWVPDVKPKPNFSGQLGHLNNNLLHPKYLGIISRLQPSTAHTKYDLFVLLSGPEPQRTILENKLLVELKNYNRNVLFVRGIINNTTKIEVKENVEVVNYLGAKDLEKALNKSELVLSRSGYSTIMDLAVLGKKAFFIPTPGQFEQEYLAKKMQKEGIAPFCQQHNFKLKMLDETENYSGFKPTEMSLDLDLFSLFKGE